MQEVQAPGVLRADQNGDAACEGIHQGTNRVVLQRDDGTLLAVHAALTRRYLHTDGTTTWHVYDFEDVALSHRAALSALFGLTVPQLFDGCYLEGLGPFFVVHTTAVSFRALPVLIKKLQLVRADPQHYVSWDDARMSYLAKALATNKTL